VAIYNRISEANIISLLSPNNHFDALQIIYNYKNSKWKSRKQLYTTRVSELRTSLYSLTVHISVTSALATHHSLSHLN